MGNSVNEFDNLRNFISMKRGSQPKVKPEGNDDEPALPVLKPKALKKRKKAAKR